MSSIVFKYQNDKIMDIGRDIRQTRSTTLKFRGLKKKGKFDFKFD